MAAETLSLAGMPVDVYDPMPSPGHKFLLAGIGGLNITHGEPYGNPAARVRRR
jgi:predicted flavoprotein YhiN